MNHNPATQPDRTILSRDRARRPRRSAVIGGGPEVLEGRQLLSTDVWTGGNSKWNDATNWSGSAVPVSGDDLVFGAAGTVHSTSVPSGFTPGSITVQSNFSLSGTLNVSGALPVTVSPSATLALDGTELKGTGSLSKLGDGSLAINTSNAQQATGLTITGTKGPISIGTSGSLPITIKVSSNSKLMVGPASGGGAVNVSGTTVTGADNALAGTIEVTSGSTFSPSVINNGFFSLDSGSTLTPGQINGGYFSQGAGNTISTAQALNGTFTLKPGGTVNVKSADYGSAFADGLPAAQSTPNDYTLNVAPDAGTTGTFGSTISGGGKFVTSGVGTVNLVHGITTPSGALESATLNQSGDTVFSAAITHLVTSINIPNSSSLTVSPTSLLDLGASSLTVDKGSVTLNQGSKLALRLDGTTAGTQYGQLVAGGKIELNNATLVVTPGFVPTTGTTFTIVKATGAIPITGQFAGLGQGTTLSQGGQSFQINYSAQAVTLTSLSQATTTTIAGPSGTIKAGVPVTLTASVAGSVGTPTGTVTFLDGSTALGTATLTGGVATLSTASLIGGNHTITASYAGDKSFSASNSTPISQAVRPATTLSLAESPTATTIGDPVVLVATASSGSSTPTGQVTFLDGATTLGTSSLDASGHAQLTTSNLAVGTHAITASYGGDALSTAATSPTVQQPVSAVPTTIAVVSPTNPSSYRQTINLTATVGAGRASNFGQPTGSVAFQSGSVLLGIATLDASGHATLPVNSLPVGKDPITANYSGDLHFAPSTGSAAASQTVVQAATSTSLTVSPNPPIVGRQVLFTATVTSAVGSPTGIVEFKNGSRSLGKVAVVGGQAFLITSLTSALDQSITATYGGNTNFTSSDSQPLALSPTTAPATPEPSPSLPSSPVPAQSASPTPQPITVTVNPILVASQPVSVAVTSNPVTSRATPVVTTPLPTPISLTNPTPVSTVAGHTLFGHRPLKHGHPITLVVHPAKIVVHPARHVIRPAKPRRHY